MNSEKAVTLAQVEQAATTVFAAALSSESYGHLGDPDDVGMLCEMLPEFDRDVLEAAYQITVEFLFSHAGKLADDDVASLHGRLLALLAGPMQRTEKKGPYDE